MNYDQVSQLTADDNDMEDLDLRPVEVRTTGPTLRHKLFYVCIGACLAAQLVALCWLITLSYSADALHRMLGF